jgi:predicted RNA-binding protein with PUA-like domain
MPKHSLVARNYWLVKSEPDVYSFDDLLREQKTAWTGVRNYQARNNLLAMEIGDAVLCYHSNLDRAVVGMAEVARSAYPDPTTLPEEEKGNWVCVDIRAVQKVTPISLATIKAEPRLADIALIKQSRLSVLPLTPEEYTLLCALGGVKKAR